MRTHCFQQIIFTFAALAIWTPAQAGVSVSSGNEAGLSSAVTAIDIAPAGVAVGAVGHAMMDLLTTPQIKELARLDTNRVRIKWECAVPGFDDLDMIYADVNILRQAETGEWIIVHSESWRTNGEWVDTAASIGTTWRYAMNMSYSEGSFLDGGSDSTRPLEIDYVAGTYGMIGFRDMVPNYTFVPPGHDFTGEVEDRFMTVAFAYNQNAPSFIPTNPAFTPPQALPTFRKDERRYRPENPPPNTDTYSELSTRGYVVRGQPFKIRAEATIGGGGYPGCLLGFTPLTSVAQPNSNGPIGTGTARKQRYTLDDTEVQVRGTRFEGLEDQGFDSATAFAIQALPADGTTRRIKLTLVGNLGTTPTLTTDGPIVLSNETPVNEGIEFDVQATTGDFDTATVTESANNRTLKIKTLPPKVWSVGLYPVDFHNLATGEHEVGPDPPAAADVQDALNALYGKQANVFFNVTLWSRMTYFYSDPSPPQTTDPPSTGSMKWFLWANSEKETFVLFWVPRMEANTGGQAFAINSRGAVIAPSTNFDATMITIFHELGHCFNLSHCWQPDADASLTKIADLESERVMGYRRGKFFRIDEIVKINRWVIPQNPLGGN